MRTRTSVGTPPSAKSTRTMVTRERKESSAVDEGGMIYKSRIGKYDCTFHKVCLLVPVKIF